MIVIRTNCNGTLGHLARTRHLAAELIGRGHETMLLLDHPDPDVPGAWLDGSAVSALYAAGEEMQRPGETGTADEVDDAERVLARFGDRLPKLLIVDDYRLGADWERVMRRADVPLVAIDDLRREHAVDLLVEPGFAGDDGTWSEHGCPVLRGTEFVMLDPSALASSAEDDSARVSCAEGVRDVLFSLGGGGDLTPIAALLEHLVGVLSEIPDAPTVTLRPVIGPQASGAADIEALAARHPGTVRPVRGATSLVPWLRRASLFVGAAGTAIYESAACGVPAITFPIADNQKNEHDTLERIGHYLHLDALRPRDVPALSNLVTAALAELPRLRALRAGAPCKIDGRGASRVAEQIDRLLSNRNGGAAPSLHEEPLRSNRAPAFRSGSGGSPADEGFRIVACDDRDINRYLDARNLATNRGNMTSAEPISRLAHYRWWLTTTRQSWRVERAGETLLYIWHQRVLAAGMEALIGGWFVSRENADIASVMAALQWQVETTDRVSPTLPWLAVISRRNAFTRKMNLRAGFLDALAGSLEERAIGELFPNAPAEDFHLMYRPAIDPVLSEAG